MNVIPAIDLRGGRCVRLLQGDFDRETEYSNDPVAMARTFSALAVTTLHVVDLDGARTGVAANTAVVRQMTDDTTLDVQLGGGIREHGHLEHWFDAGVSRCVIGSVAVKDPARVGDWLKRFGGARIVLALDVTHAADGTPFLATDGWTRTSTTDLWAGLDHYVELGAVHVLCTDIERDGALSGPNIDLYRKVLARYPEMALQASGGVRDAADLHALAAAGIPAAITGRALLEGRISPAEVESFRQSA